MKILLISVGSRGDVEPFCALAQALLDAGHEVDYALQKDYHHVVPQNVQIHSLPYTSNDFYKFMTPTHGADHPNPRVRFIGTIADCIAELVFPCWQQVLGAAQTCDIIVSSSLARSLAFAITQKLSIPTYLIHLQPLLPTGLFPHYSNTDKCVERLTHNPESLELKEEYLEGYWELERYQFDFLKERLDKMYTEMKLDTLLTFEATKRILSGNDPMVHIVNAFSNELIPDVPDAGPFVHNVGPLGDAYIPKDFVPPQDDDDLAKFLKRSGTTVCVGFGSMPYETSKVRGLLEVTEELNQNVVLVGKALKISNDEKSSWTRENSYYVDSIPYSWLLPHCSVLVCHGGAGAVQTALRAGTAVVVSPLMGDQFTFAKLLEAKGLGAQAGPSMNTVTKEDFKTALEKAINCVDQASRVGQKICQNGCGVDKMVKIVCKG